MELLEQIKGAGIVGCGGAGFPTARKLDCRVEWLIINGAECEPLLRTDRYLMRHEANKVVKAAAAAARMTEAAQCVIALKRTYTKEIEALSQALEETGVPVELFLLDSFYPAGDEQMLVYEVTGRVVPPGGLPLNVGTAVSNVATMNAVYDSMEGVPLTEKYITVTGEVKRPVIVKAPLGTTFEECIRLAGGSKESRFSVINGGPMMGKVLSYEEAMDAVVTKTTSGLIVLDEHHYLANLAGMRVERMKNLASAACIQCSYCTQMCPRHLIGHPLEPHKIMRRFATGDSLESLLDDPTVRQAAICCQCGICEQYACPMGLTPRRINALIKDEMGRAGIAYERKETEWEADPERGNRKVPTKRAAGRAGVLEYYDYEIDDLVEAAPSAVRIPLKQHIGAPSEPVVREGDTVAKGQLIAGCPEGKLGADIHASIAGVVTKVADYIAIEGRG